MKMDSGDEKGKEKGRDKSTSEVYEASKAEEQR